MAPGARALLRVEDVSLVEKDTLDDGRCRNEGRCGGTMVGDATRAAGHVMRGRPLLQGT